MKRTADGVTMMMDRCEAVLRDAGVKATPQRLEIYRQVAATSAHPDIETIHRAVRRTMPHVSLDTVYRALALFAGLGLVSTIRPQGHHHIRFDANVSPHHHFICGRCGVTLDFEDREFDRLRVPASVAALGRVASRHVELRGLCAACAARPPRPAAPRPVALRAAARLAASPRSIGTRSHRPYIKSRRRD